MWFFRLLAAGIVLLVLIYLESIRECRNYRLTRYTLKSKKFNFTGCGREHVIVFLSDLHNHDYGDGNKKLLEDIRHIRPDLILIGGDMLIGKKNTMPKAASDFIRQLPTIAPVYCANGNHEQRMKEHPEWYGDIYRPYKKILCDAGVHFLENETTEILLDGQKISITGLELPMETYEKFKSCRLTEKDVEKLVGKPAKNNFQILLAHNPVYFDAYKSWGADLTLSGHLHGGVFRIPGWRGVITPQGFLFPEYSGEMTEEDGKTIIVSKGMGTHTINFRVFNPPEAVVINLVNS